MAAACLHAFRCAAIRTAVATEARLTLVLRDKGWRESVQSTPGWSWTREMRKLRAARQRDERLLRAHGVDGLHRDK